MPQRFIVMSAREKIAATVHAEIARQTRLAQLLQNLDPEVAARAEVVFESVDSAAEWLLSSDIPSLPGGAPVELARTLAGKRRVLQTLARIEHGVF